MLSAINKKDDLGEKYRYLKISDYNKHIPLIDDWNEIPINEKNEENEYIVKIESNDISNLTYDIDNIRNDDLNSYAMFKELNYENKKVSFVISFTKKENLCYLITDYNFDYYYEDYGDGYYDYYSDSFYSRFKVNLYGSDDKNNFIKIGSLEPNSYDGYYPYWDLQEPSYQRTLILVEENKNSSNSENHILNPKYMFNFNHDKRFIYYKIEYEFMGINYDMGYFPTIKLSRIKCFSKLQDTTPIANFPLFESENEKNNFTPIEKANITFDTILNKQCAYFSGISYISCSPLFLSNIEKELTLSFFCFIEKNNLTFHLKSDFENNNVYQYFLSKLENSGYGISYYAFIEDDIEKIMIRLEIYINNQLITLYQTILCNEFCNKWNFICFTYNGKELLFYLNENYISHKEKGIIYAYYRYYYYGTYFRPYKLFIGCNNNDNNPSNYFVGYLREITIYKKALLSNNIKYIYQKGL